MSLTCIPLALLAMYGKKSDDDVDDNNYDADGIGSVSRQEWQ